ncbi:7-deoxyloganetic acid glucosyl transferase-like [Cornus florida]|uniref:7-deoxyloganetic acid glucosyl transferase-like n=1 Tax=Cornus florida TaxID=4283 RepID=UPI00289B0BB3|nr:7-deoxyloganetic acid glucosyl transferase-like [Cornus florida]
MDHQPATLPPHILLFPVPIQGHVNPMLKLAELLCFHDLHVTMLISEYCHSRLLRHGNIQSRSLLNPAFRFKTIPDGLPEDHPRVGVRALEAMPPNVTGPLFSELMTSTSCLASETRRPVTCIIADGILSFVGGFALEKGIPIIYFPSISACSYWACFCIPQIIEADEIPLKGNGMGLLVKSIPGTEGFLRRRDLPSICRANDINDPPLQFIKTECRKNLVAHALVMNTFDELEGSMLSHLRTHFPNIYTIGPLNTHLRTRLATEMTTSSSSSSTSSGSFWEEDRNCLRWLHSQPSKSVIYVSFGSITVMTREQYMEFWYGLVNSGQRFLWVIRPDFIAAGEDGESQIPVELEEGTRQRGFMVGWAPQEEVLAHPAIGGFLTHSGWNSTMESITAGVPMICWPYFADQMVNSRLVSEVWKLGLDMKDTCDRVTIEKMVRDLMAVRKEEFQQHVDQTAKMAKRAVSEGGSSYCNLDRLIQDIKSMIVVPHRSSERELTL